MRRLSILIFSFFNVLILPTAFAQDDASFDDEEVVAVKKKVIKKVTMKKMKTKIRH